MADDLSQASNVSQLNGSASSRLQWSVDFFEQNFKRDNGVSLLELVRSPYFKGLEIIPSRSTVPDPPQPISKDLASVSPDNAPASDSNTLRHSPPIVSEPLFSDTSSLTPSSTPPELQCREAPNGITPDWSERMKILENTACNVRAQADLDIDYWEGMLKARKAKPKYSAPREPWYCAKVKPIPLDTAFDIGPGHPNWPAVMAAKEEMENEREMNKKKRALRAVVEEEPNHNMPNKRRKKTCMADGHQNLARSLDDTASLCNTTQQAMLPACNNDGKPLPEFTTSTKDLGYAEPKIQTRQPECPEQSQCMGCDGPNSDTSGQEEQSERCTDKQPAPQSINGRAVRKSRAPKGTVERTRYSRRLAGEKPSDY